MHIHTHAINYLAWRGRLERHGVDCLAAAPFLVVNMHSTEKLQRSARIRHILQPRQGPLEVLTAQLAVGADSEDRNRASTSRHKPVTSSAIYNAFDGAVLQDVRRRFQTLIFARDGYPARTLTLHRGLNYKLALKAAKDTMEQGLYKQFKNQMEAAYKDTSKE